MNRRSEESPHRCRETSMRQTARASVRSGFKKSGPKALFLNLKRPHALHPVSNPTSRRSSVTRERKAPQLQQYLHRKLHEMQEQSPSPHLASMEQVFHFGGSPQTKRRIIHSRHFSNHIQDSQRNGQTLRHALNRLSLGQSQKHIPEQAVSRGQSPQAGSAPSSCRNRGCASTPRSRRVVIMEKREERQPSAEKLLTMTTAATLEMAEERNTMVKLIADYFAKHDECPNTTLEFYKVGKLIGKGAFGKVISATHKLTGLPVAMKAIEKEYMADEHHRKKVFQEVFILNKIRHKRVIKILEVFESTNHLLITMEYAEGGDLLQYVKKKQRLAESEARNIFQQVVEGAIAIHDNGVLHRDFKLDNILLDCTHQEIKICDFGVSRMMRSGQKIAEQCGTPAYIAPEIIADRGYEGFFSDTWSLGVCLYAMLCGTVPFKATNLKDLHKLILTAHYEFPLDISPEAKDLITRMIHLVPSHRIALEDVLLHQWMQPAANSPVKTSDLSIDKAILEAVKLMGFPQEHVVSALRFNEMNHATATYFLLQLASH